MTNRHATGAIGLDALAHDPRDETLSGACSGPPGTRQRQYVYLPEGLSPVSAEGASFEVPQSHLLEARVDIGPTGGRPGRRACNARGR